MRWKRLWSNMRDMTVLVMDLVIFTYKQSICPLCRSLVIDGSDRLQPSATGKMFESDSSDSSLQSRSVYSKTFIPISSFCDSWELYSGTLLLARRPCKDCTYYEKDESSYDSKNALKIFNITCWAKNKNKLTGSAIMTKSSEYKLN